MAKSTQQGQRGERGLTGPRGPRGKQGRMGHVGKTGISGPRGAKGLTGQAGPNGRLSAADREEILSHVQGQVNEVHRELTEQMKRMGSLKRELDELRANVARLSDG
jgi:hypothetical protein